MIYCYKPSGLDQINSRSSVLKPKHPSGARVLAKTSYPI